MTHPTYAVLTPAGWQIATKVKASDYGKGVPNVPGEALVWSQLYTSAWLMKVGDELAYVELRMDLKRIEVDGERLDVHPAVADLLDGFAQAQEDKRRLTRQIDIALSGEENAAKQASLCDMVPLANEVARRYAEACDRLFDIMLGDDGEAHFQAERFLKAHRPDLYNRLGLNDTQTPDMFKENDA